MKVNKKSVKQQGEQMIPGEPSMQPQQTMHQMPDGSMMQGATHGQPAQQQVDPAIQQITEFISNSINDGEDPVSIVMGLVDQEIDEQIIAQAFMTAGYEEEDLIALFEEVQKKSQPPVAPSPEEQNKDPQEIARKQAMELEAAEANTQQDQAMVSQQDAMSQTLMGKSGIEIKPENEGKFTRWAKAHGMSVPEASNAVMSNTDNYSSSVVKMANFAKNAAGWKKEEGGDPSNYTEGVRQREGSYNPPNRKYTLDPRFRKEGGEFKPHFMFKGERKIRAKDMATHLRLKERGYDHEAPKAADGTELTEDEKFYNRTGVVKREDVSTYSPNYMNPLALASNKNFNLDDAASVLKDGYNTFLGDEGIITDRKRRKAQRKENKGNYYDYDLTIDENDPNTYGFDNLDLFNASKNNGGLRDLQTFTNDVNENSKANYNVETGEYDVLRSSRPLNKDIYGEQKGFLGIGKRDANSTYEFGQNLNYFNEYENDATKNLILGTLDDPERTTLGIDKEGIPRSYAPDAYNPYEYDTMMGYNKVSNSMIPTGSNGQPTAGMYKDYQDNPIDRIMDFNQNPYNPDMDGDGIPNTVDRMGSAPLNNGPRALQSGPRVPPTNTAPTQRPSFSEWRIQNAINFQGKSEADLQKIYNSIEDDEFRYGGALPKDQDGNGEQTWLQWLTNPIRERLAENIYPESYANAEERITEALKGNKHAMYNYPEYAETPRMQERTDLLQLVMGQQQKYNTIKKSNYKPTTGDDDQSTIQYYSSPLTEAAIKRQIINGKSGMWEEEKGMSDIRKGGWGIKCDTPECWEKWVSQNTYSGGVLGEYKVDYGKDDKGQYISYYDKWDLAPFKEGTFLDNISEKAQSLVGITTPEMYGRIYIDDLKNGGSLPKAQPGTEFGGGDWNAMFLDPFEVGNNNQNINVLNNPATGEPWEQSQQSIEQYPDLVGIQDIELPEDIVYDSIPKGNGINNASGMFNVNQDFGLPTPPSPKQQGQPSYEDPTVERRGKLRGATNRVMDRLKPFGKVSDFAVKGAGLLNDWFRDKRVNKARVENRDNLVADEIHGTNENLFMDRGTWDINTGTFGQESDRYAQENMGIAKQGGETANVDSIILAKLIAAGADIEIL